MKMQHHNPVHLLVADGGSTKTAWQLTLSGGQQHTFVSRGMNPALQDDATLTAILQTEVNPQLKALLPDKDSAITLFYYGAGCLPFVKHRMADLLRQTMGLADVSADSDLLGAARALCGHTPGIACILGTGSNSCRYDGKSIIQQTPPLGYILGDEGSGTAIGKRLVADVLKGLLPDEIRRQFHETFGLSEADIIRQVYREPEANRFLASLAPFVYEHRTHPALQTLLYDCFNSFLQRNVAPYAPGHLPIHFVGSIAWHFRDELSAAVYAAGYDIGHILQEPIQEITRFHLTEEQKDGIG